MTATDDDLFEPDWDRPKRTNRLTLVLVTLLVAALAFGCGAQAQKGFDAMQLGQAGKAAPVAAGDISSISPTTLTVTDDAGKVTTVIVPPTATITTSGLDGLAVGTSVTITGTTEADGTVTAAAVIARPAAR